MFSERLERIQSKLEEARKHRKNIFGYEGHKMKLHSKLMEEDIAKLENKYSVIFPEGYRDFLLNVGNGGAGPGYGMTSLEEGITYSRENVPEKILSTPFDHLEKYVPDEDPIIIEMSKRLDAGEITEAELDECYESLDAGTLVVSHEGCGYLHRLVVSGPSRGRMWMDGEVSDQGYFDMGVDFLGWYENWLNHILAGKNGCWWFNE